MGFKKGSKVAIFEDTRWEWITSMLGLWTQEYVGVTVYANLGYDALVYALKEAECGAIICNGANVPRVAKLMSDFGIKESVIIYLDELPANCDAGAHKVLPWKTVVDMGAASSRDYSIITNNDQDVLIMYTSGTTGNPKGVCHSIGALTQGSRGLNDRLTDLIGHEEEETYLSYLPAAHVFEFICECIMLGRGTVVCFGSPRTLTDLFARPAGDITTFKPFFLIGVPRIFETIKKGAEGKLPPVGTVKRALFDRAYASRLAALKEGYDTPFWNEKVFKIPRAMMGGKMRGICSGGAPLAHKTQEWMNVVIGQPVAQGYGMTETVCNTTVQRTGELNCVAGQLLKGVEVCLLDTETYKHTDKPNPRGELLVRGKFMFKGYYKQEKMTKECMLEGGWLRTGDVAEIDKVSGQVQIIGRVKALVKNALGEYIALENLEALYCQHPISIPNGVCVVADSHKSYITALVLTDESKAMAFAHENNLKGSWPDILKTKEFNAAVAASMAALGKKEKLMPFELLKYVQVLNDEWTPENNLVTASLKVRRTEIDKHYAETIKQLFAAD
ncbi:long-chain acyl-CoA synthetase [Angomonas deanei]|uniref:AMP-binding enzyme, putative n=1 Tax=Angomonas deanei TaxID=59799 RepID=A0A7G2CMY7_9TRYP|nr:long-chain acyl-CoA synthetase [Angomonas deanei]CAD2221196.1 AMP-binding enzyme, putative [Angomonas deanei]|eukprot:EPY36491.1 long-chain acyl-CoA synthetase [Angomonas deanei]